MTEDSFRNEKNEKVSREITQSETNLKKMVEEKENQIIELQRYFHQRKFITEFKDGCFPYKIDPEYITPPDLDLESLFSNIKLHDEAITLFFKAIGPTVFESNLKSSTNLPILKVTIGNDRRTFTFDLNVRREVISKIHYEIYLIDELNKKTNRMRTAYGSNGHASIDRRNKATFNAVSDFYYSDISPSWTIMLTMTRVQ